MRGASVSPHRSRPNPSSGGVKRIDEMLLGGKAWSTSRLSRDQENHAENIDKLWRVRKDNSNVSLFRIILIPELYTQPSVGMDRHQQAFLRGWHCAHFLRPRQLETTYSRLLICRPMMMIIYSWQCKSFNTVYLRHITQRQMFSRSVRKRKIGLSWQINGLVSHCVSPSTRAGNSSWSYG